MARSRIYDVLQLYSFWVFDASGTDGNALFSIFDPVFGFSGCSAPQISVELKEIKPGNFEHKKYVVKSSGCDTITLSRGARFYVSDFYNWLTNAIRGIQPVRRNLVIVQFMGIRPKLPIGFSMGPEFGTTVFSTRIPARAWYCSGCLPTRYKASGDFDAMSSEMSIMELEVQPEYVNELTTATVSPIAARALSISLAVAEGVQAARGV